MAPAAYAVEPGQDAHARHEGAFRLRHRHPPGFFVVPQDGPDDVQAPDLSVRLLEAQL